MPTLEDVELQRNALDDIITIATAELAAAWPSLPAEDPEELKRVLPAVMLALVEEYGSLAAVLASDWYEELREEAQKSGTFLAVMAATATLEQMQSEIEWAAAGAFTSPTKALTSAVKVLDKYVGYGNRDTIDLNTQREQGVTWARWAQDDACAFCALLATRGGAYRTQFSATLTTGAGTRPSRQGKRGTGEKYHDNCRCVAVPVFEGLDYEYPSKTDEWASLYADAVKNLPSGARDTKAVLAYMREHGGLR